MSHLCTMHRPPLSKERTGGDHFGERNSWRVEKTLISPPFKAPTTPQPLPPPSGGRGTPLSRAPSTSLPQFLTKKEEFSTYPSSGLCWRDTQRVEGEGCAWATYFQVSVATQSQCPPWRIGSQTRRWCFVASPVCSTAGAKSLRVRSFQKGCTPKSLILS